MDDEKLIECGQAGRDSAILRNLEPDIIFYGPHQCEVCGWRICRVSIEQGGMKFDYPEGIIYPNTNWVVHNCPGSSRTQYGCFECDFSVEGHENLMNHYREKHPDKLIRPPV